MKLYELGAARAILDGFLEETEGEETAAIADLFSQWQGEVDAKVEATAARLREIEAEAAAIKTEEERLRARRVAVENGYDRLKGYLVAQMDAMGLEKVKTPRMTVQFQNGAPTLVVDGGVWTPDRIAALRATRPDLVRVTPETIDLDRKALLAVVKEKPDEIAGMSLRTPRSLRIR